LDSVGTMYSRARFSRWRQGLSDAPGGAALAGVLAGVLVVLLGLGAAGVFPSRVFASPVFPSSGTDARAAAANAAGPARAAVRPGPGGEGPAGPGSLAPGASTSGSSAPATSGSGGSGAASGSAASQHTASQRSPGRHGASRQRASQRAGSGQSTGSGRSTGTRAGQARAAAGVSGTSCRSVAHIGDSTSVGLVSPLDLPDPAQRLAAQYRDVGVRHSWIDASGGRSMAEEMPGQVNGYDTARAMVSRGFRGCWVIALGTNDTANVSAGSNVGRMARIQELMSVAHGAPVMWVNVKTLDPAGPWAEANMQTWNDTLLQACRQYPNLRIFDWAAAAQDGWFISDGIHYTPAGYAARANLIARALARAFPRSGHAAGCVIS
jgi:hypothetical protein